MVRMARAFSVAAGLGDLPWDPAWVEAQAKAFITRDDALALVAEGDAGAVVGMICAEVGMGRTAPYPVAQEWVLWIDPPSRDGRTWRALMGAYRAWADARGCVIVASSSVAARDVGALYRRIGMTPAEQTFFWINRGE